MLVDFFYDLYAIMGLLAFKKIEIMPEEKRLPFVLPKYQRNQFYQEWLGVKSLANLAVASRYNYNAIVSDQEYYWLGDKFHKAITANLSSLQDKEFKAGMTKIVSFSQREDENWKLGKALDPAVQRINLKRIIGMLPAELQKWLAVDFVWLDYKYRKVLVRQLSIMMRCAKDKYLRDYLLLGGVKYSFSYSHFFGISKTSPKSEREKFFQEFFQNFSNGAIENQKQEFAWIYEARHKMQKINQQLENRRIDIAVMGLDTQRKTIALQFWFSPFFKAQLFYSSDTEDDFGMDAFLSILKNDLQREQLSAQQIAALKVGINVEQWQQLEGSLSRFRYLTAMQNGGLLQSLPGTWGRDLIDYTHEVGSDDDLKYELFYDVIKQKLGRLLFGVCPAAINPQEIANVELLITLGAEFNLDLKLPPPNQPHRTEYPLVSLARMGKNKSIDQYIRLIGLLLTRGALVNVHYDQKDTALQKAVASMDTRVIKMLLNAGANPNFQNVVGYSSLHIFAEWLPSHLTHRRHATDQQLLNMHDENEVLALLLNAGTDINCKDKQGRKAYQLCSCNDSASAVWQAGLLAHKERKDEEEQAQAQTSIQKNVFNWVKR